MTYVPPKRASEMFSSLDLPPVEEMQGAVEELLGRTCQCCQFWGYSKKSCKHMGRAESKACKKYRVLSDPIYELQALYLEAIENMENMND